MEIEIDFSAEDPKDLGVNITCEGPDVKILNPQGVMVDVASDEDKLYKLKKASAIGKVIILAMASAHASAFVVELDRVRVLCNRGSGY